MDDTIFDRLNKRDDNTKVQLVLIRFSDGFYDYISQINECHLTASNDDKHNGISVFGSYHSFIGEPFYPFYCKDCAHFQNGHLCKHWSKHGTIEVKPDDFCSYAERKKT